MKYYKKYKRKYEMSMVNKNDFERMKERETYVSRPHIFRLF